MRAWLLLGAGLVFGGCAAKVSHERVFAMMRSAVEVPAAPASAVVLPVDPSASSLAMLGAKITAQHPIWITDFAGEVVLDGDRPHGVRFVAQVESIETDIPRLTDHLKTEDFLYVEAHPTSVFESTSIERGGVSAPWTHSVSGNLTIRGVVQNVTFPAVIEVERDEVTANAEFVISRQKFGVTYPGRADDLIQDTVALVIQLRAERG